MKSRLSKWLGVVAIVCSGAALAEQNWLVTPDEVKQEAVWEENNPAARTFRTRAFLEDSPDIILVTPVSLLEPLKAPFPIHVSFKAKDGAIVKPESFRVLYGFLKIDITERLASRARIGTEGASVENADIPAGNHRLVLRVSDDRGRQGETELRFSVQ